MKEEEKSCCCHEKETAEPKTEIKALKSFKVVKVAKTTPPAASSCCNSEKKEAAPPSCCTKTEVKEEKESCCCHSKNEGGSSNGGGIKTCCSDLSVKESKSKKIRGYVLLGISLVSLVLSFILTERIHGTVFQYFDIGWIAVIICGIPIFKSAVTNVRKGKITSSLLISTSILACITLEMLMLSGVLMSGDSHGHGYIFAAGEVAFLMMLGETIEKITVGKARSGVERLIDLTPKTAKYRVGNELVDRPIADVKIGDTVIILPNSLISVDGEIVLGDTAVDESIMTGEAVPVDKRVGDKVFGGTVNKSGAIEVKVTKTVNEMALTKLKSLVEEAEGKKAPISRTADKWAGYIVPAAIFLSIAVFFLTYFAFTTRDLPEAIMRGVTMLVVVCPCALALATPTAIAAGLGAASKRGVLIKSGAAMEVLAKVKTVAFDKTGTLTKGNIEVEDIFSYGITSERLIFLAGSCESMSEHPLAAAVAKFAKLKVTDGKLETPLDPKSLVGTGAEGTVDGKRILVCKWDYLSELKIDCTAGLSDAKTALNNGKTVIAVVADNVFCGILVLNDQIRDEAAQCVKELKDMGISSVMLTGDNRFSANAIASKAGIDGVYSQLLPEDKLSKIESMKSGGMVCMVGDGVNDAPALAASDCSIAMGALGSDVAIETADIALLNSDLKNVAGSVRFSKKVLSTIKINIILSMSINLMSLTLNLLGLLTPVTGALIHNCSSVLVALNSALLLKRWKVKKAAEKAAE